MVQPAEPCAPPPKKTGRAFKNTENMGLVFVTGKWARLWAAKQRGPFSGLGFRARFLTHFLAHVALFFWGSLCCISVAVSGAGEEGGERGGRGSDCSSVGCIVSRYGSQISSSGYVCKLVYDGLCEAECSTGVFGR